MDEPVHVAQILNRMDSGGIEAVVMNYYRHIDRSKVQFDFYFASDSHFPQREELMRLGAGIYPIPAYSHIISYHRALRSAFSQRHYTVVHAHLSTMSVFPLYTAWRAKVPVRICHNHSTAHWGEGMKTLLKYVLRPFNKLFANRWFACGETSGRWMYGNEAYDTGHVCIVPNAIDVKQYAFNPVVRQDLRKELAIGKETFVVGHVGRFTFPKNQPYLIDIFEQLHNIRPDSRLLLIGEGEMKEELHQKVASKGLDQWVIFAGVRQDVNKLYSVMDAFCLPSFYEGMPVVAWEAQANRLPCVISDRVTEEACLSDNCHRIGIHETPLLWASTMASLTRQTGCDIPDICVEAVKLQNDYLSGVFANERVD